MSEIASTLICNGCGHVVESHESEPFRCPNALSGGDVDHVLRRRLKVSDNVKLELAEAFLDPEPNPFLRYRKLLHSYQAAVGMGADDAWFVGLAEGFDRRMVKGAGKGFVETPFREEPDLTRELGCASVAVKNETGNVGGTHKGRHLAGLALWLLVQEQMGSAAPRERSRLAISSCGNAAWAAALIASSLHWPLDVYVPAAAPSGILSRLQAQQAELARCERREGEAGDPCYLRFAEAVEQGAFPFTCQGPSNGLVIEGGQTLVWEMISTLMRADRRLDRLFVQTGGGALGSAVAIGWNEARKCVDIGPLPKLHAVQTRGAFPLVRAYDALAVRVATRHLGANPGLLLNTSAERSEVAERIRASVAPSVLEDELRYAARHRSEFMRPWKEEPQSYADAILDDETYDWLPVLGGMLESGGFPVVASEECLHEANGLARTTTGIHVSGTGSAGLAGALELAQDGLLPATDRVALLFTGEESARQKGLS